jgi:predicted ester cyclase
LAKSVIRKFDAYNMARGGRDDAATFRANVHHYMMPDLLYESVGFGTWSTPAGWARGEEHNYGMAFPETVFTQMLFFGDQRIATTTTYGSALWKGDLFGVKAPNQWVKLRITDFYNVKEEAPGYGRVSYNFMMIDWADSLLQIGRRMLPEAPLEEGIVLPPAANDGVPAPLSVIVQSEGRDDKAARAIAEAALQRDWAESGDSAQSWHDGLTYYGPGGIGLARNLSDYKKHVVGPFQAAFADRTALVELSACEGNYCGLFGRLSGHGVANWLGLPTVGKDVSFRFAMHYRIVGDKV